MFIKVIALWNDQLKFTCVETQPLVDTKDAPDLNQNQDQRKLNTLHFF